MLDFPTSKPVSWKEMIAITPHPVEYCRWCSLKGSPFDKLPKNSFIERTADPLCFGSSLGVPPGQHLADVSHGDASRIDPAGIHSRTRASQPLPTSLGFFCHPEPAKATMIVGDTYLGAAPLHGPFVRGPQTTSPGGGSRDLGQQKQGSSW